MDLIYIVTGDGLPQCTRVSGFTVWKSYDFGLYLQVSTELMVSNIVSLENQVHVFPFVYSPSATAHQYASKPITIFNATIIGRSNTFGCDADIVS